MLIDELRLGRLIRSAMTNYDVFIGYGLTYPASLNRVGILVSAVTQLNGAGASACLTFTGGLPMTITGALRNNMLLMSEVGDLVTKGFVISAQSANPRGVVIELFLPEDSTRANLSQFRSYIP